VAFFSLDSLRAKSSVVYWNEDFSVMDCRFHRGKSRILACPVEAICQALSYVILLTDEYSGRTDNHVCLSGCMRLVGRSKIFVLK
jgi:hypothetical protein